MSNLIDKSTLVAEIKRRMNYWHFKSGLIRASYAEEEDREILSFLDTLEVKEVDLEKEWKEFLKDGDVGFKEIAKHFFELGLKAQFDKELVEEIYSHIDSIKDTADRMTSGNFMHNRAAIKFSANTIAKVLELIGLKAQKGK